MILMNTGNTSWQDIQVLTETPSAFSNDKCSLDLPDLNKALPHRLGVVAGMHNLWVVSFCPMSKNTRNRSEIVDE